MIILYQTLVRLIVHLRRPPGGRYRPPSERTRGPKLETITPPLVWCLHLEAPGRTISIEIPLSEDYLIVIADHEPSPQDWAMVLRLIDRLCPASPYALSVPEYDGKHDLWTAVYDPARLRQELGWL